MVRRKPLGLWFADFKAEVKQEWGAFVATSVKDGSIRVESDDSFFEAGIIFAGRGPVAELLHAQWVAPNDPNEWYATRSERAQLSAPACARSAGRACVCVRVRACACVGGGGT